MSPHHSVKRRQSWERMREACSAWCASNMNTSCVRVSKRSISDLWCLCPQSLTFRPDSLQCRLEAASSVATWLQGLVVPVNHSTHSQRVCEAFIGNTLCSFLKTKVTRTFQKQSTKSKHWLFNSGLVWNTKRQKRHQRERPHIFSFENCFNSLITQIIFQHANTTLNTIELPPKCKTFVYELHFWGQMDSLCIVYLQDADWLILSRPYRDMKACSTATFSLGK